MSYFDEFLEQKEIANAVATKNGHIISWYPAELSSNGYNYSAMGTCSLCGMRVIARTCRANKIIGPAFRYACTGRGNYDYEYGLQLTMFGGLDVQTY